MYQRFKWDPKLQLVDSVEADAPVAGQRVFVCSTMELFHPDVPKEWRDYVFSGIEDLPHTFIILTKRPERIDRAMPDNVWLGVSVTGDSLRDTVRTEWLARTKARIKFISFEPILTKPWLVSLPLRPDWLIAGRLTGHGKIHDPARSTIEAIVEYGKVNDIGVFLKDNLKDIWSGPLIQEFPR
jgi:protein gp37